MEAAIQQFDGITMEYVLAPKMVVFSHGFGVRRDTSGFFTEIAQNLPVGYGYLLFDYYGYDEPSNTVTLTGFSAQVKMLQKVLSWTAEQTGVEQINIVAHSIGSIVAAMARPPSIHSVIMLAPPTHIGDNTRNYFTGQPGSQHTDGVWLVPRRDGTTSKISEKLFDEFETTDAATEIVAYAEQRQLTILTATADEVLTDTDYTVFATTPNILIIGVAGASHNFVGDARPKVIQLIREHL